MRCNRQDCGLGEIDDEGFCTECSRRPLPETSSRETETRPATSLGRIRPEPWWGLDLVDVSAVVSTAETAPKLDTSVAGRTIAGRYNVEGLLGAGLSGNTFLARDRKLDTDVVVKHLSNPAVARTALDERNVLVGLRHDSIVRVLGYEPEGPYLVLEYVPGPTLSPREETTPLEVVLGHGVQILQALDYLHARGLLHCDVKPANIVRFRQESSGGARDRVRLIDFGAVRTTGHSGPVTTYSPVYAPREGDPEHEEPTEGFDLYCLGKTLGELCDRHLRASTEPGVDSLRRLLKRATGAPDVRFKSARQFAEQLSGVIRQVVAERVRVPRTSVLFGEMNESLHGGLGVPRPLEDWIAVAVKDDREVTISKPFSTPTATEIAAALPTPLSDPEDDKTTTPGVESGLDACRDALRRGAVEEADSALAATGLSAWHWLRAWYAGLIALTGSDPRKADEQFTTAWDMLPGEMIPRLALGLCAELRGNDAVACLHYRTVVQVAPAIGAAAFGLARVLQRSGHLADAVEVAERLMSEFRYAREGRIAAVRLLASSPAQSDLARARDLLAAVEASEPAVVSLTAEIDLAELRANGTWKPLSKSLRKLATFAPTQRAHTALVDQANAVREPIAWTWWKTLSPRQLNQVG